VTLGNQFYGWKKPEYPEKTTDLSQATNELSNSGVFVSATEHGFSAGFALQH
jgi:hypothetical protein